jgi:hypothetical protein
MIYIEPSCDSTMLVIFYYIVDSTMLVIIYYIVDSTMFVIIYYIVDSTMFVIMCGLFEWNLICAGFKRSGLLTILNPSRVSQNLIVTSTRFWNNLRGWLKI